MRAKKENPLSDESLAAESEQGACDALGMPDRLARYSKAHRRAVEMAHYAKAKGDVKLATKLESCGHYLLFRDYYTVGKIRLHAAKFCQKHMLCPLCAIRRGAKMVRAYLVRLQVIQAENLGLMPYMVTFTVKNGDDLGERFLHLAHAFRRYQEKRRNYFKGRGPFVEMARAQGAVFSFEFKRGANSGQWHPHVHMVWLCSSPPDQAALSAEWLAETGDSFIVDARPMTDEEGQIGGFLEVFKYAVKFSDLPLGDNWDGWQTLAGKRLIGSFGLFWGVKVPEELTDEGLDEDFPFVELLYRYLDGAGYSLQSAERIQPFSMGSRSTPTPISNPSRVKPEAAAERSRVSGEHRTGEDFRAKPGP